MVPVFTVSSVTGENLDLLEKFFNVLPSYSQRDLEEQLQEEAEFHVYICIHFKMLSLCLNIKLV